MKQVPVVMVLMSRRTAADYYEVFKSTIALLERVPAMEKLVLDYESALWKALNEAFPTAKKSGCCFHFRQAIYRKVQDVGLAAAYLQDESRNQIIRKLMAICLLPPTLMRNKFHQMQRKVQTQGSQKMIRLFDYLQTTWLRNSLWSVENVSVYGSEVRTNNDIEGRHNRLNKRGRNNMPLYSLIDVLHTESQQVQTTLELIKQNKLTRHQEKKYVVINRRIFCAWKMYIDGAIDGDELFKELASFF